MSNLRKYHLELAHKFQIENPHLSVTVSTLPFSEYISVYICLFDSNGEVYEKISIDSYDNDFTERLENLVEHGYNPEVSA